MNCPKCGGWWPAGLLACQKCRYTARQYALDKHEGRIIDGRLCPTTTTADPQAAAQDGCQHTQFQGYVDVERVDSPGQPMAFRALVRIRCQQCGT